MDLIEKEMKTNPTSKNIFKSNVPLDDNINNIDPSTLKIKKWNYIHKLYPAITYDDKKTLKQLFELAQTDKDYADAIFEYKLSGENESPTLLTFASSLNNTFAAQQILKLLDMQPIPKEDKIQYILIYNNKDSAFMSAIKNRNIQLIKSLLDMGIDINTIIDEGWTPLTRAVAKKDTILIDFLLENNADINLINGKNRTPLMTMVEQWQYEMVKYLLENGADVNAKNNNDCTALMFACRNTKNLEIARLLLEYGADPDAKSNNDWADLIDLPSNTNNLGIVKLLENYIKVWEENELRRIFDKIRRIPFKVEISKEGKLLNVAINESKLINNFISLIEDCQSFNVSQIYLAA